MMKPALPSRASFRSGIRGLDVSLGMPPRGGESADELGARRSEPSRLLEQLLEQPPVPLEPANLSTDPVLDELLPETPGLSFDFPRHDSLNVVVDFRLEGLHSWGRSGYHPCPRSNPASFELPRQTLQPRLIAPVRLLKRRKMSTGLDEILLEQPGIRLGPERVGVPDYLVRFFVNLEYLHLGPEIQVSPVDELFAFFGVGLGGSQG